MKRILSFIKTYWLICTTFAGFAVMVSSATYWFVVYTSQSRAAYKSSRCTEQTMQSINLHLRSVDAHLRSIDAKEDSNTREIQKVGTVVTVVSKKVLTRETFDRYFRPVLNFDYPGVKKTGYLTRASAAAPGIHPYC